MLEALAAGGVVAALAVAVSPRARGLVIPVAVAASGLSLVVSVVALLGQGRTSGALSAFEALALLGLVFLALRRAPARRGVGGALLAAGAALIIIPSHVTTSDSLLANAAGMAVWGLGALVAAGAARYLDALDARRARSVAEARRDQRLSLARDLHDFVAHDVSAIVVQAQAARVVGADEPGEALAALERIEHEGLHALAAMDRALDALRDVAPTWQPSASGQGARPPGDGLGLRDLGTLIARFEATGAVRVELELADAATVGVPSDVGTTAYRLVTEGLTNIRRHAPGATRVRVGVAPARLGDAAALAVTVTNDAGSRHSGGHPLDAPGRNGGFGLHALRERVEALGGILHAGPDDEGCWQLSAVLPVGDRARRTEDA
jgi:signal transduction histidine kinase